MNEAMYTNQTFDSSGFHNETNQHLSNMAPSPFTRQSSNYPELTDAEICSMTGQQLNEYYAMVDANQNEDKGYEGEDHFPEGEYPRTGYEDGAFAGEAYGNDEEMNVNLFCN